MKEFPYQTITAYHDARSRQHRRWRRWRLVLTLLLVAVSVGERFYFAYEKREITQALARAHSSGGITIPPGAGIAIPVGMTPFQTAYVDLPKYPPMGDPELEEELTSSVEAWSEALHYPVKRPKLVRDDCGEEVAIACQIPEIYAIGIARNAWPVDWHTIFMHEIGHLLGVPHIQGDLLMDPVYRFRLQAPTPDAVAIAKAKGRYRPDK